MHPPPPPHSPAVPAVEINGPAVPAAEIEVDAPAADKPSIRQRQPFRDRRIRMQQKDFHRVRIGIVLVQPRELLKRAAVRVAPAGPLERPKLIRNNASALSFLCQQTAHKRPGDSTDNEQSDDDRDENASAQRLNFQ